jgi:anti-sigma-K factor RskA
MSDHSWLDFAAPYALDVLEGDELVAFEAHLRDCPVCQGEVQEMREVTGLLAHAASPVAPPAGLRDRVLAQARQARPTSDTPPVRPITSAPRSPAAPAVQKRGTGLIPWLAAAASLVLAVGAGWELWQERGERAELERVYADARSGVAARDSLIATLLAPQVQTTTLTATGQPPAVRLFLNREQGVVVLAAHDLPPAPGGRTYQLWGIPAGQSPVSLGTFNTGPDGRVTITLRVPAGMAPSVSAITEEPTGGSPQPTTTPFLVGSWG